MTEVQSSSLLVLPSTVQETCSSRDGGVAVHLFGQFGRTMSDKSNVAIQTVLISLMQSGQKTNLIKTN